MKSRIYNRALEGVYEAVGGIEALRRVSVRFHHRVSEDPTLRGFFPQNMGALEERVALYLAERAGGPEDYTATRGKTSLFCRHAHLAIGTGEAECWLAHMAASLEEEGIGEDARKQLLENLTELVATLADPFVPLYHLPLESLSNALEEDPTLARANDRGRNLICAAAQRWDVPRLRLLLKFGADVETQDAGGHNPLYRVANGSGDEAMGQAAVVLLIAHGANVNQITGVGGMTPLHMSARRGTVRVAEALLEAGANIEARDKNGETPLRRAVNCGQEGVAGLLMSRGADPLSADRNGRTPRDAARTESMRACLNRSTG